VRNLDIRAAAATFLGQQGYGSTLMRVLTLATALLLAPVATAGAASAQGRYDGRWSVEIVTLRGDCDKAYRYGITIRNGQPFYNGSESVTVQGRVANNGAVRGRISYGDAMANVVGRLDGATGSGTWTAGGSRSCSGRWNAERRG
jgi:hypothetical protein